MNVIAYSGLLPELDLGDIKISNIPIDVRNKNDAVKAKILFLTFFQCDGVIGWDLLHKFDFSIDYKNKLLTLRKPIEKNIEQKNLFWYEVPIIKFYTSNNYPLLFFFDSGCGLSSLNTKSISNVLRIDTNNLKKQTKRLHGANKWIKTKYYKYPDFQCYTISNNEMTYLTANKTLLEDIWCRQLCAINLDGWLGSDWFKDKTIRVDMKNGVFEITE